MSLASAKAMAVSASARASLLRPARASDERAPAEGEHPPQPVLGRWQLEGGCEGSGALVELAVVEQRHRAHGHGEELDAVAPADAEEVGDDIAGPEEPDRLVGGSVNLACGKVVQAEAGVQRGRSRGLAGSRSGRRRRRR